MKEEKKLRHIPLQGAYNVRDLGGYPTKDEQVTKWGRLFRADALSALTEADWKILKTKNICTIIDLRSQIERAIAPITPAYQMKLYACPLMNELETSAQDSQSNILDSMKLDYTKTLFGNLPGSVKVLNHILEELESGGVLFLCSAGKDRTGIIASLVLYLCGVIREDIIADYIISSTYNANGINKMMDHLPEEIISRIPDKQVLKGCFESNPEMIIPLLDAYESKNIRKLLEENGFSLQKQQKLAEILLSE